MKTYSRITLGALFFAMSMMMACKKNEHSAVKLSTSEMAQKLYVKKDFIIFTSSFAQNFKHLSDFYRTSAVKNQPERFIQTLRNASNDVSLIEAAHAEFGLSLKDLNIRKSMLDNDIVGLYEAEPELFNYDQEEFWSIIFESVQLLKQANEIRSIRSFNDNISSTAITGDEIWDCIKEAVGLGAGSMLGIAGLHALAQRKGIQQAVVKFAALMARNMGYIGLAITVIDFSSCMYKESKD